MVKDGGLAFPCYSRIFAPEPGMTLRQYYAAKVMQAIPILCRYLAVRTLARDYARIAFEIADAMIAFEEEEKESES